ncbi:hypothetical protein BH23GEM6_BH23GEM6_03030 [soil metagenome]
MRSSRAAGAARIPRVPAGAAPQLHIDVANAGARVALFPQPLTTISAGIRKISRKGEIRVGSRPHDCHGCLHLPVAEKRQVYGSNRAADAEEVDNLLDTWLITKGGRAKPQKKVQRDQCTRHFRA